MAKMATYKVFRFDNRPPQTYREAIQKAIRQFVAARHQMPAGIVVGPSRADEAHAALAQINADLAKLAVALNARGKKVSLPELYIHSVGGCLLWEVGLVLGQNGPPAGPNGQPRGAAPL
jgi:hypothetical protein